MSFIRKLLYFIIPAIIAMIYVLNLMEEYKAHDSDLIFSSKIKSLLGADIGNEISLSAVNSGEWNKVCVAAYGGNMNLKRFASYDVDNVKVLNHSYPYSNDEYSAVVFVYADNVIEVYRGHHENMLFWPDTNNNIECVERPQAFIKVIRNAGSHVSAKNSFNDYIEVMLFSKEGE